MGLDIDISLEHPKKDSKNSSGSSSNLNKSVLDKYYNSSHAMSSSKKTRTSFSYNNSLNSSSSSREDKQFFDELYEDYSVSTYKKKIAANKAYEKARVNAARYNSGQSGYSNQNYSKQSNASQSYSNKSYSNNSYSGKAYSSKNTAGKYAAQGYSGNNYSNKANTNSQYSGAGNLKRERRYTDYYSSNEGYDESYYPEDVYGNEGYGESYYSNNTYGNEGYGESYYSNDMYGKEEYSEGYDDTYYSDNSDNSFDNGTYGSNYGYADEYGNEQYSNQNTEEQVKVYYRKKQKKSSYNSDGYDEEYFAINENNSVSDFSEDGFSRYSEKIRDNNHVAILDARQDMLNTAMIDISSHLDIETKREQKKKRARYDSSDDMEESEDGRYYNDSNNTRKKSVSQNIINKCKDYINNIDNDEDYVGKTGKGQIPGNKDQADVNDSIAEYRKRSKKKKAEKRAIERERYDEDYSGERLKKKKREKREYGFSDDEEYSGVETVLKLAIVAALVLIVVMLIKSIAPNRSVEAGNDNQEQPEYVASVNDASMNMISSLSESENDISENDNGANGSMTPNEYGFFDGYQVHEDENTGYIYDEEVMSQYGVLIDLKDGRIVAQKNAYDKIYPASMTKIMTLLVAVEHLENAEELDKKVAITQADTDYAYSRGLSAVNWDIDEEVTVRDLLYGTILPSGGDAAHALAVYTAGSEEEFAVMMNDKLAEMGLSETTHFTNCSGYYDDNHYSRMVDVAMILKAAESNEICREVLDARKYTTSSTAKHADGILISNLFLRRIEDKDTHGEVHGAKTGFVNESGCCAASYEKSNDGNQYICVTGNAGSSWRCIYDHVQIYDDYVN